MPDGWAAVSGLLCCVCVPLREQRGVMGVDDDIKKTQEAVKRLQNAAYTQLAAIIILHANYRLTHYSDKTGVYTDNMAV